MIAWQHVVIAAVAAIVVAVAIRLWRARNDPNRNRIGRHDILMRRAEVFAGTNAFLRKACADYRKSGHLSERQLEAVEKALARLETAK
jgi:hypothetical protein